MINRPVLVSFKTKVEFRMTRIHVYSDHIIKDFEANALARLKCRIHDAAEIVSSGCADTVEDQIKDQNGFLCQNSHISYGHPAATLLKKKDR